MATRPFFSLTQSMTAPPAVGPWPGTTTGTNVDWEKRQQEQMQAALSGLGTLVSQAEAAQYARQQESDQLRNQYLAAASAPPIQPPPLAMALPYAAAQFSAALSGRPEIGQQADQSLAMNRATQLQRRSQILDTLAQQNQEAARRAEQAGNLADSLKYNTKASMLLKQLEESQTNIRDARKTAETQAFEAWKTRFQEGQQTYRAQIMSGLGTIRDPAVKARVDAAADVYDKEMRAINEQLQKYPRPERVLELEQAAIASKQRYYNSVDTALEGKSLVEKTPPPVVVNAADFLAQHFAGATSAEVLKALRQREGKSTLGMIIANKYGINYDELIKAASSIQGPGRAPLGRFNLPQVKSREATPRSGGF